MAAFATMGAQASTSDSVVIIYAQFPGYAAYELGTGTFVDHDGLILTADHVVHHLSMSPPSSYTTNSMPSPTQPTSIRVYSAFLNAAFDVDLTRTDTVVSGQLGSQQWMDVAFLRVSLTETQRSQLQPLDLSQSAPAQGETVDAYGPLCTKVSDTRCFQPGVTQTVINNAPAMSRDYQVRDNIIPGYSGGPLVNASGNIVGIASWGDVIQANQVVVRASYMPSPYVLRFFLSKLPPSSLFMSADACTRIHSFPYLTNFDWQEISAKWISQSSLLQGADQCTCCCESLDKTRSAVGAPSGSCAPPFCAERRFYALKNALAMALETKTAGDDTVTSYEALRTAFSQINLAAATTDKRAELYADLGSTLAQVATNEQTKTNPAFSNARQEAILALNSSQLIHETPENYFAMANLFRTEGDTIHATAADVLGNVINLPPATLHSEFKINADILRKNIQAGIRDQTISPH